MNDHTSIRDPNLERFVQDFDALAELMQTLIDRDRRLTQETAPAVEWDYTTEWQMEPSAELTHSL